MASDLEATKKIINDNDAATKKAIDDHDIDLKEKLRLLEGTVTKQGSDTATLREETKVTAKQIDEHFSARTSWSRCRCSGGAPGGPPGHHRRIDEGAGDQRIANDKSAELAQHLGNVHAGEHQWELSPPSACRGRACARQVRGGEHVFSGRLRRLDVRKLIPVGVLSGSPTWEVRRAVRQSTLGVTRSAADGSLHGPSDFVGGMPQPQLQQQQIWGHPFAHQQQQQTTADRQTVAVLPAAAVDWPSSRSQQAVVR